jgi:hypothetical protein
LAVAGALLAAPVLISCGGDNDEAGGDHETVSVEEFCSATERFENIFGELDPDDLGDGAKALKDAARELKGVGTPADIPDDAREGLELTLDKLIAVPDDASSEELFGVLDLTGDEKAKSMAFESYLDQSCDYRGDDG